MRAALGWVLAMLVVAASVTPLMGGHRPGLIWVPLDSRPVNTYEVSLLAEAAGIALTLPPGEALDWYASRRSDFPGLVQWLRDRTRPGDTQVLYMNSLLTGGLIASRDAALYAEVPERLRALRAALRQMPPGRRIAVHVLPRAITTQFSADGSANPDYEWRETLLEQTAVRHRLARYGLPADQDHLHRLELQTREPVRRRAEALLQHNATVLDALVGWLHEGVLSELIIGLDDAQPFSETKLLHEQLAVRAADLVASGRLHLHYGADEIGFLLVAREAARTASLTPAFSLDYDRAEAGSQVLPYEAVPLAESVAQKLALLGGRVAAGARQRIVLHTVPWAEAPEAARTQVARIVAAVAAGQAPTVVDVSGPGARDGPYIRALADGVPLGSIGYAGWNTASNSVGTALAMATISDVHTARGATAAQARAALTFRAVRYAYDLVYQSQKAELTRWAVRQGISPTGFGSDHLRMQERLSATAGSAAQVLLEAVLQHRVVPVGADQYQVCAVHIGVSFPWQRLFEVAVRPELRLARAAAGCPLHTSRRGRFAGELEAFAAPHVAVTDEAPQGRELANVDPAPFHQQVIRDME